MEEKILRLWCHRLLEIQLFREHWHWTGESRSEKIHFLHHNGQCSVSLPLFHVLLATAHLCDHRRIIAELIRFNRNIQHIVIFAIHWSFHSIDSVQMCRFHLQKKTIYSWTTLLLLFTCCARAHCFWGIGCYVQQSSLSMWRNHCDTHYQTCDNVGVHKSYWTCKIRSNALFLRCFSYGKLFHQQD